MLNQRGPLPGVVLGARQSVLVLRLHKAVDALVVAGCFPLRHRTSLQDSHGRLLEVVPVSPTLEQLLILNQTLLLQPAQIQSIVLQFSVVDPTLQRRCSLELIDIVKEA